MTVEDILKVVPTEADVRTNYAASTLLETTNKEISDLLRRVKRYGANRELKKKFAELKETRHALEQWMWHSAQKTSVQRPQIIKHSCGDCIFFERAKDYNGNVVGDSYGHCKHRLHTTLIFGRPQPVSKHTYSKACRSDFQLKET